MIHYIGIYIKEILMFKLSKTNRRLHNTYTHDRGLNLVFITHKTNDDHIEKSILAGHAALEGWSTHRHSTLILLFLCVPCPSKAHIETAVLEFTVLLGQSTEVTAKMFKAISTTISFNIVLSSHLSTIETRVHTPTTCY